MKNQVYVSLDELLQHPSFRPKLNVTKTDRNYGTVKDYCISVVASADGKHYGTELTPADPHLGFPATIANTGLQSITYDGAMEQRNIFAPAV
jgi:hypothetical protein